MKSIHNLIKKLDTVKSLQLFQLFRFGGFFLTGILLAKGPLSINTIGVYESLMFFSGAVSFFWISGMLNGLLAKFKLVESGKQGAYLFNISIFISLMNVLLVLLLFFSESFAAVFLKPDALIYYRWLLLFILFNNPVFLIEYLLLIKEQTVTLFFYGLINFILQVLIVVVPLWLGFDLSTSLKGLIILAIIKLIFLGVLLNKFGEKKTDFTIWREHLNYSTPLILSLLISGSSDYIDGALVSSHFGPESFAIFRYGAKELPISMLLANALSTAFVPRLADKLNFEAGLKQLKKESTRLMHLVFPLSIILLVTSHWLYPLVFRTDFQESAEIFNIYLLLVISRVLFPQTVILALQRTEVILKVAIVEIIINIIASYFLMLKFGMIGVAFGTIIAFSSEKVLLILVLHKKNQIPISKYLDLKKWTFYSLVLLICYYFVENFLY